jgi:hypothetical protein
VHFTVSGHLGERQLSSAAVRVQNRRKPVSIIIACFAKFILVTFLYCYTEERCFVGDMNGMELKNSFT